MCGVLKSWISGYSAEGAFGYRKVGIICDRGDEVSGEVRVGKTEETLLRTWRGFARTLVGAFIAVVVTVIVVEARECVLLVREALAFLRGAEWGGCCSRRYGDRWCNVGIHAKCVKPLLLGGIIESC